jgi:hypothetical protein
MSDTPVASREAALRIALAARTLNGLDVRALVGALIEKLDTPLTEKKLGTLTVDDLRIILAGDFAEQGCHVGVDADTLKEAVRLLWGQGVENSDFPAVDAYTEGEMPGSLRVAIAANRGENLDGHFGSCERFLIYQVGADAIKLIAVRSTVEADAEEDKNAARSALINDCQIVYVQSFGGPAAAKVVAPASISQDACGGKARSAVELQAAGQPPPWLAQIMGVPSASLARFEEELESEESA